LFSLLLNICLCKTVNSGILTVNVGVCGLRWVKILKNNESRFISNSKVHFARLDDRIYMASIVLGYSTFKAILKVSSEH